MPVPIQRASPRCILCGDAEAYATLVNVNSVLLYYKAIYQFYQGIYRKNIFFGSYAKILCKLYYVNYVNEVRNRSEKKQDMGGAFPGRPPYLYIFDVV